MRLIVGVALDERAKTTVSVADNGDSVYLRNGGHLLRIPAELLPTLASEFVRVDAELKMAAEVAKPIGPSCEPPFDVAKALDAEAARQEAEEAANPEPWNDRPWHWVSAAAVAPGDVVWLAHIAGDDPDRFGYWAQVVSKVPDFAEVHWTLNDGSQATVRRTKSVRLADKVHPDPCGGGDLPEPGRSFDVV